MKNQVGSTRIDTVLKMLAISFVSLFAFCTGVFIGKQMSDSDYQLKALESDFNKGSKHAANGDEHPEDAIADEEVAALSEKYMNSEKEEGAEEGNDQHGGGHGETRKVASTDDHAAHGDDHGDSHAAPAAAHGDDHGKPAKAAAHAPAKTAGKPDLSAAHKAATRVANNAAPTEAQAKVQKETPRVPNSLPKTVGASQDVEFTVQVASYPTADAAKEHANELVKKGFPAFPVEATVNNRTWYRVSVGSFKTNKEATTYRARLLKQAELQSAIVQRIQR